MCVCDSTPLTHCQGVDGVGVTVKVAVVLHLPAIPRGKHVHIPVTIATLRGAHLQRLLQQEAVQSRKTRVTRHNQVFSVPCMATCVSKAIDVLTEDQQTSKVQGRVLELFIRA